MSVTTTPQSQTTTPAAPTAPTTTTTKPQKGPDGPLRGAGGVLGILVFLAGVALLLYVFATAIKMFDTPPPPLPSPPPVGADGKAPETGNAMILVVQSLRDFILRFLMLLLMCVAGSLIASRGIEMFFKACSATRNP